MRSVLWVILCIAAAWLAWRAFVWWVCRPGFGAWLDRRGRIEPYRFLQGGRLEPLKRAVWRRWWRLLLWCWHYADRARWWIVCREMRREPVYWRLRFLFGLLLFALFSIVDLWSEHA